MTPSQARAKVAQAIKEGVLVRPTTCELCGCTKEQWESRHWIRAIGRRFQIMAHHWNGYDNPLDIWWICQKCNTLLPHKHDGSLTVEEARKIVGEPDLFDASLGFVKRMWTNYDPTNKGY